MARDGEERGTTQKPGECVIKKSDKREFTGGVIRCQGLFMVKFDEGGEFIGR